MTLNVVALIRMTITPLGAGGAVVIEREHYKRDRNKDIHIYISERCCMYSENATMYNLRMTALPR